MVNLAIDILVDSQSISIDVNSFHAAQTYIKTNLFPSSPTSWFRTAYESYKILKRPQIDYDKIKTYIKGEKILDFGAGAGFFAHELVKHGYSVQLTDVLDYRSAFVRDLEFVLMVEPRVLPFRDNSIDTAIVRTVLHHINNADLSSILKELHRIARRIIIEEDTCGIHPEDTQFSMATQNSIFLEHFMSLSVQDQFDYAVLTDYFSNAIVFGASDINFPFLFKSPLDWKKTLKEHNFTVSDTLFIGFEKMKITKNCQIWFIADRS